MRRPCLWAIRWARKQWKSLVTTAITAVSVSRPCSCKSALENPAAAAQRPVHGLRLGDGLPGPLAAGEHHRHTGVRFQIGRRRIDAAPQRRRGRLAVDPGPQDDHRVHGDGGVVRLAPKDHRGLDGDQKDQRQAGAGEENPPEPEGSAGLLAPAAQQKSDRPQGGGAQKQKAGEAHSVGDDDQGQAQEKQDCDDTDTAFFLHSCLSSVVSAPGETLASPRFSSMSLSLRSKTPGGSAPWTPAAFEKVDETFNSAIRRPLR